MMLYLRLAWRNIWRHRRRTMIVVLSICVCVSLMIVYDGLVGGFEDAIYGNAINVLGGNIQVHAQGYQAKLAQTPLLPIENDTAVVKALTARPEVNAVSRRIITGGLVSNYKGAFAVSILGVEPEQEAKFSLIAANVPDGRYLKASDQDLVLIGKGLASAMEVKVGDRITLAGRATHEQMRKRSMTVVGIYDLGMGELEKQTVYVSLAEAQDLSGLTAEITEIAVSLKDIGGEPALMKSLQPALGANEMVSWQTNYPEMQSTLATKSGVMNLFSSIILVIVGIGILNLLLMAVFERTREIGIMGAMGMKPRQISLLFVLEGAMMGLVGLALGVGLGLAANLIFGQIGFDFGAYSNLTDYMALISGKVYPTMGTDKLLGRSLTVIVIAILSSLYPAREAAMHEPAQALHYV